MDFKLKIPCLLKTLKDMLILLILFRSGTAVYEVI